MSDLNFQRGKSFTETERDLRSGSSESRSTHHPSETHPVEAAKADVPLEQDVEETEEPAES